MSRSYHSSSPKKWVWLQTGVTSFFIVKARLARRPKARLIRGQPGDLLQSRAVHEGHRGRSQLLLAVDRRDGFVRGPIQDLAGAGLALFGGLRSFSGSGGREIPTIAFPRPPTGTEPGIWHVYGLPRPNVGDYSPTELVTTGSGSEMLDFVRHPGFDSPEK
jgi:hypothetical protein